MPADVAPIPEAEARYHAVEDPHRRQTWLVDALLGGQDGVVNVLGVVLGVAVASAETRIVLAAGVATALAESVSMAAVAYTSSRTASDVFRGERAREYRHVRRAPNVERAEVRSMYEDLGFRGELLDRVVATITANEDVWVAQMMAHEHHLTEIDRRSSLRSAALVGAAAAAGSLAPLAPFVFLPLAPATWLAVGLAAAILFAFGAFKASRTVGAPARGGAQLMLIGLVSALAGFGVGLAFRATP
ncbi:MAG TPA: VIT1/CCC1 transporter family protein [Byssovorax sp.]|jgi:VIT1/CCC1 family predicted Fe2+/Mn2+ transporter